MTRLLIMIYVASSLLPIRMKLKTRTRAGTDFSRLNNRTTFNTDSILCYKQSKTLKKYIKSISFTKRCVLYHLSSFFLRVLLSNLVLLILA